MEHTVALILLCLCDLGLAWSSAVQNFENWNMPLHTSFYIPSKPAIAEYVWSYYSHIVQFF